MTITTGVVAGVGALTANLDADRRGVELRRYHWPLHLLCPDRVDRESDAVSADRDRVSRQQRVAWEGRRIRMEVILQALPSGVRRWLELLAEVTVIVVSVILIWLGWPAIAMLVEFDQRSQAAEIPLAIPQARCRSVSA
ncbi:MAG: TRAP transporter small permease [Xanthobacteraceae bacterium]